MTLSHDDSTIIIPSSSSSSSSRRHNHKINSSMDAHFPDEQSCKISSGSDYLKNLVFESNFPALCTSKVYSEALQARQNVCSDVAANLQLSRCSKLN